MPPLKDNKERKMSSNYINLESLSNTVPTTKEI